MSEDKIQAQAFQWLHNTYPLLRNLFFAVPNGGSRHIVEAMKLKATGVIAGIPDMILLYNGTAIGFEFKAEKGILSDAQLKVHFIWNLNGYKVYMVRSFEQFETIIKKIVI